MPQISNKAKQMPASAIRKLGPVAEAAKAAGAKVYHLNIGAPDIKSPAGAFEALKNLKIDHISYANSAGMMELRKALVEKYYKKIGIDIEVPELLVNIAGTEAVETAIKVTCDPGDEIIVIEPFYTNYATMAFQAGVTFRAIHTDIREGFKAPGIEEFRKALTPKTKAVLLCNPGNPTGTYYPKEAMLEIGQFCVENDIFLISDEVYREFCYSDDPYFSAMNIPGADQHVILVDSVSKRYNLCGARIGCTISHNKDVIAATLKYAQSRLSAPVLGQIATLGAIDVDDSYFEETKKEYIARRNCVVEAINKMEGAFSPLPMGAFYTIAELPVDNAEDFCKWLLTDFRVDGETVMITPAESFYADKEYGRKHVRIAYILAVPELQKAMHILEEGLKAYNSR